MKPILILLTCLMICSCASTTFLHNGKPVAIFQGDMRGSEFVMKENGDIYWKVDQLDSSTATRAQGEAFANKATAVGSAFAAAGVATIMH